MSDVLERYASLQAKQAATMDIMEERATTRPLDFNLTIGDQPQARRALGKATQFFTAVETEAEGLNEGQVRALLGSNLSEHDDRFLKLWAPEETRHAHRLGILGDLIRVPALPVTTKVDTKFSVIGHLSPRIPGGEEIVRLQYLNIGLMNETLTSEGYDRFEKTAAAIDELSTARLLKENGRDEGAHLRYYLLTGQMQSLTMRDWELILSSILIKNYKRPVGTINDQRKVDFGAAMHDLGDSDQQLLGAARLVAEAVDKVLTMRERGLSIDRIAVRGLFECRSMFREALATGNTEAFQ